MPPEKSPLSANARGALWILVSVAGASAMMLGVRLLTAEMETPMHPVMLVFLRSAFAALLTVPILMDALRRSRPLRFSARRAHILRGVLVVIAVNGGFYAISKLPMATATILFFMAPVFATVAAGPMTGEKVGLRRWSAIAAGLLGAIIILRPGSDSEGFDPAMLIGLTSAAAFSVALVLGKQAAQADGSEAVFVSSALIVTAATLPPAVFLWALPGTPWDWAALGLVVMGSSLRSYADIRAYAIGETGFLAPFTYLRLLTTGLIGYAIFGEGIDDPTLAGGAIIVAATLYIALREARIKPGATPPATP